jgi:hypothetical protein
MGYFQERDEAYPPRSRKILNMIINRCARTVDEPKREGGFAVLDGML